MAQLENLKCVRQKWRKTLKSAFQKLLVTKTVQVPHLYRQGAHIFSDKHSHLDKARGVNFRRVIWILASDTVSLFEKLNQYLQYKCWDGNAVYLVIGTSFLKGVLASARKCNKPGLTLGSLKLWSPSWRGPGTRPIHIFLGSEERGFRKQDQSYLGCEENLFENDTHFAFFIWPTAAFISALSWSLVLSFIALVAVILTMLLLSQFPRPTCFWKWESENGTHFTFVCAAHHLINILW